MFVIDIVDREAPHSPAVTQRSILQPSESFMKPDAKMIFGLKSILPVTNSITDPLTLT